MPRFLNVGGNSKTIRLPAYYVGWEHVLLDIDPKGAPDIVCDARELTSLEPRQFDAIYCSHNLEHFYAHDVQRVLAGFRHVIKDDGFIEIRVPDAAAALKFMLQQNLDLRDPLYQSPVGPVTALDIVYGHQKEIRESGNDWFAHKTGFSHKSLLAALSSAGLVYAATPRSARNFEILAYAFPNRPTAALAQKLGLGQETGAQFQKELEWTTVA